MQSKLLGHRNPCSQQYDPPRVITPECSQVFVPSPAPVEPGFCSIPSSHQTQPQPSQSPIGTFIPLRFFPSLSYQEFHPRRLIRPSNLRASVPRSACRRVRAPACGTHRYACRTHRYAYGTHLPSRDTYACAGHRPMGKGACVCVRDRHAHLRNRSSVGRGRAGEL